jgi:ABC-type sugar transport system ATPase subunit
VLQTGAPREVYARPATPAVARALGSPPVNELAAVRRDGQWVAAADGTPLCPAHEPGPARALLGVRPEHLAPEGGPGSAVVEVVEDAGPRALAVRAGETIHPRLAPEHVLEWSLP